MQSLRATLANIDFAHEHEHAKVSRSNAEPMVKAALLRRLEQRHRDRRAPYVRQLALLEQQSSPRPEVGAPRGPTPCPVSG